MPAVCGHNGIGCEPIVEVAHHSLRLHRRPRPVRPFVQRPYQSPSRLRLLEETAIGLPVEQRVQRAERFSGIADNSRFDRESQADPRRIDVDLHAAYVFRLG